MVAGRRVLLRPTAAAALGMASLVAGFLPNPSVPATCRQQSVTPLRSTMIDSQATQEDGGDIRVTWDYGQQHKVQAGDKFVLRSEVKDYAKLTEGELAEVNEQSHEIGGTAAQAYKTAVPAGSPFAHARLLNVVVKAKDLAATTAFYEGVVGMTVLREKGGKDFASAVLGYGSEEFGQNVGLQFVQAGEVGDLGDGYQGITVVVPDVDGAVAKVEALGGKVVSAPASYEHAATQVPDQDAQEVNVEYRATVTDPNGYKVTIMQGDHRDKLAYITLRVFDAEKAVEFYGKLGMKLLRKRANIPVETSMSSFVGYDDDHVFTMGFVHEKLKEPQFHVLKTPKTLLELKYEYDSKEVKAGSAMVGVSVGVYNGVSQGLSALQQGGAKVVQQAGSQDGVEVAAVQDSDGYTVTLVDFEGFHKLLV